MYEVHVVDIQWSKRFKGLEYAVLSMVLYAQQRIELKSIDKKGHNMHSRLLSLVILP